MPLNRQERTTAAHFTTAATFCEPLLPLARVVLNGSLTETKWLMVSE